MYWCTKIWQLVTVDTVWRQYIAGWCPVVGVGCAANTDHRTPTSDLLMTNGMTPPCTIVTCWNVNEWKYGRRWVGLASVNRWLVSVVGVSRASRGQHRPPDTNQRPSSDRRPAAVLSLPKAATNATKTNSSICQPDPSLCQQTKTRN